MAMRKSTATRKVPVSGKAVVNKEKEAPLTQQARNERWLKKLEKKAAEGLPIPRRFNLILSPEAYEALEAIRKVQGGTKTDVITSALIERAKKLKRMT